MLAETGAAGAFGGYAMQLAKVAGLAVVADGSEADEDVSGHSERTSWSGAAPTPPSGSAAQFPEGVHALADGAALYVTSGRRCATGGAVATLRGHGGDGQRGLRVTPVRVTTYAEEWETRQSATPGRGGQCDPRVAGTYPAEQAGEAHRRLEAGGVRGRLVLVFG